MKAPTPLFWVAAASLLFAAASGPLQASEPPALADARLPTFSDHNLTSEEGLTYRIIIAPPAGPPPKTGYPVIYLLDGNAWTPMASEVIRTNLGFGLQAKVEPAIVVGIGYPIDGAFDLVRRDFDLTTPTSVETDAGGSKVGGYEAMARFIEQRVKPYIERRFPIDRNRQTLAGHSLGGLFALRTLIDHPGWYQTYLALSPSIWWNDAALLKEAAALRPPPHSQKARVYIGVGTLEQYWTPAYREKVTAQLRAQTTADPAALGGKTVAAALADYENNPARMVDNTNAMAELLREKGLDVEADVFPDEDHFSSVPSQLGRAIPFALGK